MGIIKQEVWDSHLYKYPREESILKPFLEGFDVTWARHRKAYNTEVSMYFLKPETFISQMFGFEQELMLCIADYPTIEARTMQAVDTLITEDPARGRVEQSFFLLASPSNEGKQWVADYTSRNPQARTPIVFNTAELTSKPNDAWLVRNIIRGQLFSRDLFDYKLPLDSDLFFFGRVAVVGDHLDAIKRSQNRGLFGLRKTGKTSILYKLQRMMANEQLGAFLYYDCKLPSIRMLRWHELLSQIAKDIAASYNIQVSGTLDDPRKISNTLIATLQKTPTDKFTALVFDEIEYVSPVAIDDKHWHQDFVPFWQTLWAAQSQVRRLSNTIVGVNPSIVERDTIGDIQNPIFGIIQPTYLRGLSVDELRGMVRFFGKRMGLSFSPDAIEYLHSHYGGHPLLTRMACSQIHIAMDRQKAKRPVEFTMEDLKKDEGDRDSELVFYCGHAVSEIRRFYPDEYELLEMLASGQIVDAMDLSSVPEYSRHLREYGLLNVNNVGKPQFAIPVIGQYVGNELARRERRRLVRKITQEDDRAAWVKRRIDMIAREMRELCKVAKAKNVPGLFAEDDFPEKERFLALKHATVNDEFMVFINCCNRCFVESVERFGRQQSIKDYFWTNIKQTYPDLWDALQRIKIYRHNDLHLELNSTAAAELRRYIETDLEGQRTSQVEGVWFIFQQCVLDNLLLGIQCEINRYS